MRHSFRVLSIIGLTLSLIGCGANNDRGAQTNQMNQVGTHGVGVDQYQNFNQGNRGSTGIVGDNQKIQGAGPYGTTNNVRHGQTQTNRAQEDVYEYQGAFVTGPMGQNRTQADLRTRNGNQ
ncbi:hypothetical protein [Ammoniphilus sp. CFH 90114]|uniref:hypothetical protein n=1 Tax=Ammoniphilus sp. CFH 90114 TaxID=2493665 RepID=UPI00100E12FC|nr:hypothetical protein [Ammoniphilus sp. CFH 90114]RXT03627.1 hypothetical protein EIZ39_23665 [Ammoniphilus sp. CFH 90114]